MIDIATAVRTLLSLLSSSETYDADSAFLAARPKFLVPDIWYDMTARSQFAVRFDKRDLGLYVRLYVIHLAATGAEKF